ncbi:MAG TPA: hypothetical protein VF137_11155 [Candidatus Dormibacteraeota bacterium]
MDEGNSDLDQELDATPEALDDEEVVFAADLGFLVRERKVADGTKEWYVYDSSKGQQVGDVYADFQQAVDAAVAAAEASVA